MPLKNYTTKVPADRSIQEIQASLVKNGATGVLFEYEKGTGRIAALKFLLEINGKKMPFSLPVQWQKFQQVLKNQEVRRSDDEDYCYRVAWRDIRDWVLAQMALFETAMVEMPQVFLPFATDNKGQTLYEKIAKGQFLLGNGEN
jgi:hypothetical protein